MIDNGSSSDIRALNLVPIVVEQTARGERAYDIYAPAERAGRVSGGAS